MHVAMSVTTAILSVSPMVRHCKHDRIFTPHPETGYCFRAISFFLSLFLCLFLCQQHYEKTTLPICMKFSGKVRSDHGTTCLNFGSIRVNGSAGQGQFVCYQNYCQWNWTSRLHSLGGSTFCPWWLISLFARWHQGAELVVPRTTACLF